MTTLDCLTKREMLAPFRVLLLTSLDDCRQYVESATPCEIVALPVVGIVVLALENASSGIDKSDQLTTNP